MKKKLYLLVVFVLFIMHANAITYDITVDIDGSGDYTSVQDAIDAAPSNSSDRTVIYIMNGSYYEVLTIDSDKTNLTFIGESADDVILYYDNAANKTDPETGSTFGTSNSASIFINGDGFYAKDITFENSAGTSYGQAVAVRCTADQAIFQNCNFLGNQDTYYAHSGRAYHVDCYFEGTTDFIFGGAIGYFEDCSIYSKGGTSLTAASTEDYVEFGYVFNNCTVTGASSDITDLGRPWRPYASVTFMNSSLSSAIKDEGWNNWDDEDNEETARFAEYNNTGDGSDFSGRPDWITYLSDSEAEEYTMLNVLKATNADPQVTDNWDPTDIMEDASSYSISLSASAGDSYVTLNWSISNIDIRNIQIYRDTDSDPSGRTRITTLGSDETSYTDSDVSNGTTYYYWVKVVDTDLDSYNSDAVGATPTSDDETSITLTSSAGDGYVTLNWSTSNIDIRNIQIMRDTDSDPSGRTRIGIAGADETTYTDSDVTNGTTYYYWVKIVDTDLDTYNSDAVEATPTESDTKSTGLANESFDVLLYPNPFTEGIQLNISAPNQVNLVVIRDLMGRLITSYDKTVIGENMLIGQELTPGMYIIQVYNETEIQSYSVTKH